jgi:hypothetical protein
MICASEKRTNGRKVALMVAKDWAPSRKQDYCPLRIIAVFI